MKSKNCAGVSSPRGRYLGRLRVDSLVCAVAPVVVEDVRERVAARREQELPEREEAARVSGVWEVLGDGLLLEDGEVQDEEQEGDDDLHVVEGVAQEEEPVVFDLFLRG